MDEFIGYVEPELKQFLDYDGVDKSASIGDEYKEVVIEMTKGGDELYVVSN